MTYVFFSGVKENKIFCTRTAFRIASTWDPSTSEMTSKKSGWTIIRFPYVIIWHDLKGRYLEGRYL